MLAGFIIGYLVLTLLIGWWASRKVHNASDFVMAGKQLPLYMASCALFATWFGSETILGAPGEFMQHGLIGIIEDPFGAALCLFLSGLLIAKPLYNLNLYTFSDYFRLRFNRTTEICSAFFMVPSYFTWISAQLIALGIMLQIIFGLDLMIGIGLSTVFVLLYTLIGGMWSVSVTDFVQTIVITAGLAYMALLFFWEVGGTEKMLAAAPPDFFRFFPERNPISILEWIGAWITIGLGSIPQQDVFQRVMAAKDLQTSIRACYVSAAMYLTIAFLPIIICYCGTILYPEVASMPDKQMMLPTMVLTHMPVSIQVIFFGALLSAILSTCSGAMLAPATVIGENIIKPIFRNRQITDAQFLLVLRISLIFVALITTIMAWKGESIFELVSLSSAFSLVSLFTPLIAGLYWKKASKAGAIASMMVGLVAWIAAEHQKLAIPSVLIGLGASMLAMLCFSLVWPDKNHSPLISGQHV